ncbi:MFS transporter [Streptomyces sp. NPDC088733]|uniref:MFS transporter n=1 Tax=Streptomyces sp. NPDC088733 TaxID=3365880 RepID=UPI003800E0B3
MRSWMRAASAMFVVGWGANQFSPLLLVYRADSGVTASVVTTAFAAYAAGLIPALLLAARFAQRFGRRQVVCAALVLSAVASAVLLVGGDHFWALMLGRLVAGVASGAAFGPGTAWIKDLSADAGPGAGARRAAVALSAGFGGGPLVAGILAQWLAAPEALPYLVHLCLTAAVTPFVWKAPDPAVPDPAVPGPAATVAGGSRQSRPRLRTALLQREFRWEVAPSAPLVFGAPTTSFAVLPALVPLHGPEIAAGGGIAGLTLLTGLLVQPPARRLSRRGSHVTRHWGLVAAVLGFLLAAAAVRLAEPALLIPAAMALGACYGLLLVAGLSQVEAWAAPRDLAGAAAVFYCLAYLGFVTPLVVTALRGVLPPAPLFVCAAATAAILIPATALLRRASPGHPSHTG